MPQNETLGASFKLDTTGLRAGLNEANRAIRESETQFKQAAAGMDDWTQSAEGLEARTKHLNTVIEQHNNVIAKTKAEKDRVVKAMEAEGKSQDEINKAVDAANRILNQEYNALEKAKKELQKYSDETEEAAEETKDLTESTEKSSKGLSALKGAAAIGVAAIAAVGAAAIAGVKSLLDLTESTRELRTTMSRLETAFTTAGHSAEDATETYKTLYGVLGDEGRANEAAAHLAQLTNNQKDLQKWTDICTGVYATFGDSLPIEGLTEAANETAKVGDLTGVLADALNWAGVNEDDFQKKLDACANEQERQALITDTLNGLYTEQSKKFKDLNKDVIAANEATAELAQTQADLGAAIEPLNTKILEFRNDLLKKFSPALMQIIDDMVAVADGTEGATDDLAKSINDLIDNIFSSFIDFMPKAADMATELMVLIVETLISHLPDILDAGIQILTTLINSIGDRLPSLVPTIVEAVILMAETLIKNVDMIIDAGISLLEGLVKGILSALPKLIAAVPEIIDTLFNKLMDNLPKLLTAGVNLLVELANGLIKAIPQLLSKLPEIISNIVRGLLTDGIPALIEAGGQLLAGLFKGMLDPSVIWENIKSVGNSILSGIKSFFGIHSPSKLFRDEIGAYLGEGMALGIGDGFNEEIQGVNRAIVRTMGGVGINTQGGGQNGSTGQTGGSTGVVINQYNTYSQAHSRYELFKTKQATAAAVRAAVAGGV